MAVPQASVAGIVEALRKARFSLNFKSLQ